MALLVAIALSGLAFLWPGPRPPQPPAAVLSAPLAGDERPIPPVSPGENIPPPSFDILRIEPAGTGAASGRSAPVAQILLRSDGATVASTTADERGEWALLIREPLPAGDHILSLLAQLADGRGVPSDEQMVVSIPEQRLEKPLIVLMTPGDASEVVQSPDGPSARPVTMDAVDQDPSGGLRIGGRAEPGTALNLYLDNAFIGSAKADDEGRWSLSTANASARPGVHRIRLDALAKDDLGSLRVVSRLDVPFNSGPSAKVETSGLSVESDAESWRIEESGRFSIVVYGAGAERTLDPTRTYPGQVTEPPEAATPAAAR